MKILKKVIYIVCVMLVILISGYILYSFAQFRSKPNIKIEDLVGETYRSKNNENYFYLANEKYVVFYVKETYYRSEELDYNNGIMTISDENDKTIKLAFLDNKHAYSSTFNMYFYKENLFND